MKFSSIELPNQSLGVKLEKVRNWWNDKDSADATITILAINNEKINRGDNYENSNA